MKRKNPKPPLPLRANRLPSSTSIPELTTLTTRNSIQIQSTVFPQLTHQTDGWTNVWTDRPTDGRGDKLVSRLRSVVLIESNAANNKQVVTVIVATVRIVLFNHIHQIAATCTPSKHGSLGPCKSATKMASQFITYIMTTSLVNAVVLLSLAQQIIQHY